MFPRFPSTDDDDHHPDQQSCFTRTISDHASWPPAPNNTVSGKDQKANVPRLSDNDLLGDSADGVRHLGHTVVSCVSNSVAPNYLIDRSQDDSRAPKWLDWTTADAVAFHRSLTLTDQEQHSSHFAKASTYNASDSDSSNDSSCYLSSAITPNLGTFLYGQAASRARLIEHLPYLISHKCDDVPRLLLSLFGQITLSACDDELAGLCSILLLGSPKVPSPGDLFDCRSSPGKMHFIHQIGIWNILSVNHFPPILDILFYWYKRDYEEDLEKAIRLTLYRFILHGKEAEVYRGWVDLLVLGGSPDDRSRLMELADLYSFSLLTTSAAKLRLQEGLKSLAAVTLLTKSRGVWSRWCKFIADAIYAVVAAQRSRPKAAAKVLCTALIMINCRREEPFLAEHVERSWQLIINHRSEIMRAALDVLDIPDHRRADLPQESQSHKIHATLGAPCDEILAQVVKYQQRVLEDHDRIFKLVRGKENSEEPSNSRHRNDLVTDSTLWQSSGMANCSTSRLGLRLDCNTSYKPLLGWHKRKFCGLVNLGSTCYLNAVVQALFSTELFVVNLFRVNPAIVAKEAERTEKFAENRSILLALRRLYIQMTSNTVTTPDDLVRVIDDSQIFPRGRQHDASELLRYFLTALGGYEKPLIRSVFAGVQKTTMRCTGCGRAKDSTETFLDICIPIGGVERPEEQLSLDELIHLQFSESCELVDEVECAGCNRRCPFTSQPEIVSPPVYLIIIISPFVWKTGRSIKAPNHRIQVNDYLQLNRFTYELYAIVVHRGPSPNSGHYLTIVKQNSTFILFDDAKIQHSHEKTFDSQLDSHSTPYILWYKCLDAPPCDDLVMRVD